MQVAELSGLATIFLFLLSGAVFASVALFTARLLRPNKPNPEKLSTYESGEDPVGNARMQFNLRFYVIAIIFLLFEVEIVFLFPWARVFGDKMLIEASQGAWAWFALAEVALFVFLLALGLAYVWRKGMLDWVKPSSKIQEMGSPVPAEMYEHINQKYARK